MRVLVWNATLSTLLPHRPASTTFISLIWSFNTPLLIWRWWMRPFNTYPMPTDANGTNLHVMAATHQCLPCCRWTNLWRNPFAAERGNYWGLSQYEYIIFYLPYFYLSNIVSFSPSTLFCRSSYHSFYLMYIKPWRINILKTRRWGVRFDRASFTNRDQRTRRWV